MRVNGIAVRKYSALLIKLLLVSSVTLLTSCGLFDTGTQSGASPEPVPPSLSAAEAEAATIRSAVEQLAARSPQPTTDEFRQTLLPFASNPQEVEVTRSSTPTNLKADSIQAAVKLKNACIISGIRSGEASVQVLPVLKTGLCFVGDQR